MFFRKKIYTPELISLHIPKTAGTSFRNILKSVYGDKLVVRFDINNKGVKLNQKSYPSKDLPSAKVIHGHFIFKELTEHFELPDDIKKITWLRDPVQRVISNYCYLDSRLKTILDEEKRGLNILKKMQRSLTEYARDERNQNRQSKFLEGTDLEAFDFVGITENFENDLENIARVLNWPKIPKPIHNNRTPSKKKELPEEVLKEIAALNKNDMQLYNKALKLRGILS